MVLSLGSSSPGSYVDRAATIQTGTLSKYLDLTCSLVTLLVEHVVTRLTSRK